MNVATHHAMPTLIAHRGNAEEFPENSLPAMSSALALGVKHLAIDVQLSRDGVPIVIHDAGLLRTAGVDRSVLDLEAKALTRLSIGQARRFGTVFESATLPRLLDVLELLRKYPQVRLLMELQRQSIARFGAEQVVDTVLALCKSYRDRIVVLSADLPAIHRARSRHGVPIGWCVDTLDTHTQLKMQALAPDRIVCDHSVLPRDSRPPRGPWEWIALGIKQVDELEALAGTGVSYAATKAPGRFRKLLASS
mgnify:FL=1